MEDLSVAKEEAAEKGQDVAAGRDVYAEANWLSRLMMFWVSPLVTKGYQELLMPDDLWPIRPNLSAEHCYDEFTNLWNKDKAEGHATVARALRYHLRSMAKALALQFGYTCCNFGSTLMLLWLIGSLSDISIGAWMAWMYGAILVAFSFVAAFFRTHALLAMVETVVGVRNSLMTAVYHKATLLSSKALMQTDSGEITNLMSADSTQIVTLGRWLAMGFIAPFDILGVFIFLGVVLGPSTLVVLGVLIISLPINGIVAGRYFAARKRMAPLTDQRLKASGEFVKYVRAVKYYAWEIFFTDRIQKCRDDELVAVMDVNNTRSYLMQVSSAVGSVSLLLVLMTYALSGNFLTPALIFTVFRLIQMLRMPFIMLPITVSAVLSLKVSFARLSAFLELPELDPNAVDRVGPADAGVGYVAIENGTFSWGDSLALSNINVRFPRGKLTMIIGQVGAGKSSILNALLGDMELGEGSKVTVTGKVAYAAQSAFIENDTLRGNVLFGRPMDEERYYSALRASDLETDIKQLPGGDMTEIGERGINLSGGQKQRVSLARALYADADVVMLDDCLSAVDAHVGEHIFRHAVQGMLGGKTVILVSNQLQFLPSADYVLAVEKGVIREQGEYNKLVSEGQDFSRLVESFGVQASDETQKKEDAGVAMAQGLEQYRARVAEQQQARETMKKSMERRGVKQSTGGDVTDKDRALAGRLVSAEETSATMYVGGGIYWEYIKSGGLLRFGVMCVFMALSCVATFIPGLWIGYWSVLYLGHDNAFYIGILSIMVASELVAYFVGSYVGMAHGRYSSEKLHHDYLEQLSHAEIGFYDRTPIGRIMNRLAKDMDDIDSMMSFQMQQYVRNTCQVLAIVALIGYASPWLLLAFFPLAIIFWLYLRFYRRTSVRLQRIESVTLSPIFQHFAETLPGLSTIRAFAVSDLERVKSNTYINADSLAEYAARTVDTWLGIRLDLICALCTAAVVFIMIGLRNTLNPIVAGFSINYVLAAVNILAFFSQNITQLETMMNSVERIKLFGAQIPSEAPFEVPENKPPAEWPQAGRIEFDHVQFSYRKGLPPVLDDLNFTIEAGQKVGIVGRTGAGKSSMLVILLRMAELSGGAIRIDGVDISKIGLHDLRSRIAIIPQDPTLFSGTVRSNLDPFNQYTNEQVWEVLRLAQMKDIVERDGGLEAVVQEDGSNFSLGQRQLLCMGRALLRRPKILLMDEATASVDMENDALIQDTVRSEFRDSTVATVAHRLHTVADSDVVMVLEKGKLAEMDRPERLVEREKSHFKSLIEASGVASSQHLMNFIRVGKAEGKTVGNLIKLDAQQSEAQIRMKKQREAERAERDFFHDLERTFARTSYPIPNLNIGRGK